VSAFRRRYGASWWHLVSLLLCFALTGYAVSRLFGDSTALVRIAIWFVGAAVVWDLVVGPLLALADAGLRRLQVGPVSPLNYLRVPTLVSLLLLVLWAPLIFERSEFVYEMKSGLPVEPYLGRWVAVTVVLLAASAVAYAVAVVRARRRSGAAVGG
jgi:hypothetical protein